MNNSSLNLTIGVWNMRGLTASKPYIQCLMNQCQIIAVSEHKLFDFELPKLKEINTMYDVYACSSKHLKHGNANRCGIGV